MTIYTIGAGVSGGDLARNNEAIIAHTQPLIRSKNPET